MAIGRLPTMSPEGPNVREMVPGGQVSTWSCVENTERRSVFQLSIIWFMAASASCDVSDEGVSPSAKTPSNRREPLINSPAVAMSNFLLYAPAGASRQPVYRGFSKSRFWLRRWRRVGRVIAHPAVLFIMFCFGFHGGYFIAMVRVPQVDQAHTNLWRSAPAEAGAGSITRSRTAPRSYPPDDGRGRSARCRRSPQWS